jgi:hypothetical protein
MFKINNDATYKIQSICTSVVFTDFNLLCVPKYLTGKASCLSSFTSSASWCYHTKVCRHVPCWIMSKVFSIVNQYEHSFIVAKPSM